MTNPAQHTYVTLHTRDSQHGLELFSADGAPIGYEPSQLKVRISEGDDDGLIALFEPLPDIDGIPTYKQLPYVWDGLGTGPECAQSLRLFRHHPTAGTGLVCIVITAEGPETHVLEVSSFLTDADLVIKPDDRPAHAPRLYWNSVPYSGDLR